MYWRFQVLFGTIGDRVKRDLQSVNNEQLSVNSDNPMAERHRSPVAVRAGDKDCAVLAH